MSFETVHTIIAFLLGIVTTLIVLAFIIPDEWGKWIVCRKNLPTWGYPLAGLVLAAFLFFFLGGIRINLMPMKPWVYWLGGIGLVVLVIVLISHFATRRHTTNR